MKIMLVNDDGYRAAGIRLLNRELVRLGHDVTICAPDRERSSVSHAFSFSAALKAKPFDEDGAKGYAIDGTPADCARLGLCLLGMDVDLVISGVNHGPNQGAGCQYSGTVAAAMEAALCGVQAVASSMANFKWTMQALEGAAVLTAKSVDWFAAHPLPQGVIYNLNVPDLPYDQIKGVRKANLSKDFMGKPYVEKYTSPMGGEYYFFAPHENVPLDDPESDVPLCRAGWATITPITWNSGCPDGMPDPEIAL